MTTAAPAHAGPPDAPSTPPRKSDPASPGWADVRVMVTTCAQAVQAAMEDVTALAQMAARAAPERRDELAAAISAATGTAKLCAAALESAVALGRRWQYDDAFLRAEIAAAYEAGVRDCKAARCRLQVVDGG
jgi:hypothetical protein